MLAVQIQIRKKQKKANNQQTKTMPYSNINVTQQRAIF